MRRLILVLMVLFLPPNIVREIPQTISDEFHCAFNVEFINFDRDFLATIIGHRDNLQPNQIVVLDEIEAFYLRQVFANNNKDKNANCCQRPKTSFPGGNPVRISNSTYRDPRKIAKKNAWLYTEPFTFEILPMISSLNDVSLTLNYFVKGGERVCGPLTVASEQTFLVLIDGTADGVYLAAMITPRVFPLD